MTDEKTIEYTDFQESVRQELNAYKERHNLSWKKIEPFIIEYNANTIGQFANGTYTGNVDKLAGIIKEFLEKEIERASITTVNHFYEPNLEISQQARDVLRYSHLKKKLGIITSKPRLGKTATAKWYKAKYSNVILILSDVGYSPAIVYEDLCNDLGITLENYKLPIMRREVVKKMQGKDYFIVVDEAENLPFKTLEALRILRDKTGIGMVWQGQELFETNLLAVQQKYKQIAGRVGYRCRLAENLGLADVKRILSHILPESDVEQFGKTFHEKCFWSVQRIIDMAEFTLDLMRAQKTTQLTLDIILDAESRLLER